MIGKNFPEFSNDWKKSFQWLEKVRRGGGQIFQPKRPRARQVSETSRAVMRMGAT